MGRRMSATTLILDATFATAIAALYAWVGVLMLRRPADGQDARLALGLFSVWWFGLALVTALGAARSLLAAAGIVDVPLHQALSVLGVVPLVAALWGLVYYLLYVYLGRRSLLWPVTVFHAILLLGFLYLVVWLQPTAVEVRDFGVGFTYARELQGALVSVALFGILGPALLASVGYGSLLFRTTDRTARYRIGMVSGAFLLWFGTSALSSPLGFSTWYWWPVAARVVGLVSTLLVLAAYVPPRPLAKALGIRRVTDAPANEEDAGSTRLVPRGLPALVRRAPIAGARLAPG